MNKINFYRLYPSVFNNNMTFYTYEEFQKTSIKLRSLSSITDEELKELLCICHNLSDYKRYSNFTIKRENMIAHCSLSFKFGIVEHICLNFGYATINCNTKFDDNGENFKVNIGEIHYSSSRTVGYIHAVDFLRSKQFLIPYMDLTIEKILNLGWVTM